jgi:hypothetical protein
MTRWMIPFLALVVAVPATAQQWQVARDNFAFAGRQLTVHVEVDEPGTLRVIRGPAGTVRVFSRTDAGMTAAGLTSDEHLTLTAAGAGSVEYVISVPERVWVTVHLPNDIPAQAMAGHDRSRIFQWPLVPPETADPVEEEPAVSGPIGRGAGDEAAPRVERRDPPVRRQGGAAVTPAWLPNPEAGLGHGPTYTVFANYFAPSVVALPDLTNVRSITIRVEGGNFRVGASRPLALVPGNPRHLEIRPAGPPMELVVVIPAGTAGFRLSAGGVTAVLLDGAELTVLCEPTMRQWLSEGRGWVTFTPTGGALQCGPAADRRHAG